jgi:hypothetical protein
MLIPLQPYSFSCRRSLAVVSNRLVDCKVVISSFWVANRSPCPSACVGVVVLAVLVWPVFLLVLIALLVVELDDHHRLSIPSGVVVFTQRLKHASLQT